MKAAIYIRVSTDDQVLGYSLDGQLDECVKYLLKRGYNEYEVYADDGYSAKSMNRPALQRLLGDIQANKVSYIIFWALDRLTRDPIDGLIMCRETFYKKGIPFASIMEEIDMNSADGELMLTIRLAMARAERRRISERTKLGYIKRAQSGKRNSPARPYGYNIEKDLELTVRKEEVPHLHMIYDWYLEGKGIHKIVRELNQMGVASPRGGPTWSRSAIMSILKNITYIGYNHWKPKGAPEDQRIITQGDHTPLIDKTKFEKVQELVNRRSNHDMSRSSYDFYFSRILKCALCGSPYYGNASMQKTSAGTLRRQKSYYCDTARRGQCTASTVSEPKITKLFLAEIESYISGAKDTKKEVPAEGIDTAKERKQIEKELASRKAEMEKLVSLYLADKIDLEIYESKRGQIKDRIVELEKRIKEMPEPAEQSKVTQEAALKLLVGLKNNWEFMTDERRKWLAQTLYSDIKIIKVEGKWRIEEMVSALK